MSIYDKSGQRIFFQREGSTYGKVYDPESSGITVWTAIPADYPHWRRFDIIEDTFDVIVPLIEKLQKFDIADSKHPSAILSGNIEPVEFTFDMTAQALEFLALSIGTPALSSHTRPMTQVWTFTVDTPAQGTYFLFDVIDSGGDVAHYGVWSDTANDQSTGKPTVTGINASNMLPANTSSASSPTNVADAVETIVETTLTAGTSDITSADNVAGVLTLIHARSGAVQMAHDGASSMGLTTVGVTTWGATNYTTTELLTTVLPSFTIHVEQRNATAAEDIIYDIFGCVVDSISISLAFGDKIATYSVTFKTPYAVKGNRNTNNPPKKYIHSFPAMNSLQESAENYLIQEKDAYGDSTYVHLDRTPQTVDSVVLTITNNVDFKSDISKRYKVLATSTKREISLQIVGNTSERELFEYFLEQFTDDGTDWYPTSASGRLNTVYKLQRDATYDYITVAIYNWLCSEHNFSFVNVDDAVKLVDMTFTDGSANSAGRLITTMTMITYVDRIIMIV